MLSNHLPFLPRKLPTLTHNNEQTPNLAGFRSLFLAPDSITFRMKIYFTHLCHNVGAFPSKPRLLEHIELAPDLAHVVCHSEAVRYCADSILQNLRHGF